MHAAWWWIDRWRKSTAYTDMTLAEQGAYRNLLDELWLRDGLLPNDERILAKICGDAMSWATVRTAVLARFEVSDQGLRNPTHDEVSARSKALHEARSKAGKKGNAARWGIANGIAKPIANGIATASSPSPSPSPSPISGSVSKEKKKIIRPKETGRQTWATPYFDAWKQQHGPDADFQPQIGSASKYLQPLNEKHGQRCIEQFRAYIAAVQVQYIDWKKFASAFGTWANGATHDDPEHEDFSKRDWAVMTCDRGCAHDFKKSYLREHREPSQRPCPDAVKVSA